MFFLFFFSQAFWFYLAASSFPWWFYFFFSVFFLDIVFIISKKMYVHSSTFLPSNIASKSNLSNINPIVVHGIFLLWKLSLLRSSSSKSTWPQPLLLELYDMSMISTFFIFCSICSMLHCPATCTHSTSFPFYEWEIKVSCYYYCWFRCCHLW